MVLRYYRGEYEPDRHDLAEYFKEWIGIDTKLTVEEEKKLVDFCEEYVKFDTYKDDIMDYFEEDAEEYFDRREKETDDYDAQVRESYYKDRV